MKIFNNLKLLISSVAAILILTTPLLAQQHRNAPKKPTAPEPLPTFDTLLAADSFKVYCEIRGVGGLVRSSAVNDLLEPIMKHGVPPEEAKVVLKWLNAHADVLAGSRMMVAGWGSRPKLPNVFIAIEFSSPEDAKKVYPELRDFLPKIIPTPTPTPSTTVSLPTPLATTAVHGTSSQTRTDGVLQVGQQNPNVASNKEPEPPSLPYQMKQSGSLVLISDTAFTFRSLRPRGSKGLEEDQNFLLARSRFASESLFLYVDLKSIEKEEREQRQKWEEEAQKRAEAEAANPPRAQAVATLKNDPEVTAVPVEEPPVPHPEIPPAAASTVVDATANPPGSDDTNPPVPQASSEEGAAFASLYSMFQGGGNNWPEAVGAGLVFENDAYVLRTLIINNEENKDSAIPFAPQFVSGPALAPESPNIFPADVDLFVSVSLDYPQIYEKMLKVLARNEEQQKKYAGPYERTDIDNAKETPFAFYEKKLGLKIKDDLLPLLGNELALALPRKAKKVANGHISSAPGTDAATTNIEKQNATASSSPMIAIAVRDREAVARLIPKIIESLGLKGASLLAQTEKRDGTEIVSYAGAFSYAFVGDFLVFSTEPTQTRHLVDAYLSHQTLSSDSHFRNYSRWQPRQALGQVYMAPGLVEEYVIGSGRAGRRDKMNELLSGVNPVIDPLTYSLSNDGQGPFHELHLPKSLVQMLVAETLVGSGESLQSSNEAVAQSILRTVASAEATFKLTQGNNGYGTIEQLISANLLSREMLEKHGYRIEVSASSDKFEITAVPVEYGLTGKLSYFIDESQILRAGDHGGGAATVSDQPLD